MARRDLAAEGRHDDVDARVVDLGVLDIAFPEVDLDPGLRCEIGRGHEQLLRQVDTDRAGAGKGGADRGVAGAAERFARTLSFLGAAADSS